VFLIFGRLQLLKFALLFACSWSGVAFANPNVEISRVKRELFDIVYVLMSSNWPFGLITKLYATFLRSLLLGKS
jgi:hypothetical protein